MAVNCIYAGLLVVKTLKRLALQVRCWRDTLAALRRAWRYRGKKPGDFPYYLSAVACVKNEAPYIAEWLEYHMLVGVEHFWIYDNESDDNLDEVLAPYVAAGIVELCKWPGKYQQSAIYRDVLDKAAAATFWLAVIDMDEFLLPHTTGTVADFMKNFEKHPSLAVNWVVFGSGGQKTKTDGLVIERFRDRAEDSSILNRFVKSINNPRRIVLSRIHVPVCLGIRQEVDTDGVPSERYYLKREGKLDKLVCHHYYGKSLEEFMQKRTRGSNSSVEIYPIDQFNTFDRNEVCDMSMDKYIPQIKENLKKRFQGQEGAAQ